MAVGFGRTGTMFACEQEDVVPDIMCMGKGITGGYMPLAATIMNEQIFQSFLGEREEHKTFYHGHTYTGNQLACALALKNIELMESRNLIKDIQKNQNTYPKDCKRYTNFRSSAIFASAAS